jgi:hypothetical protein
MQLLERVAGTHDAFTWQPENSPGPIFVGFLITCCFAKPAAQFALLLFGIITVTRTTGQLVVD